MLKLLAFLLTATCLFCIAVCRVSNDSPSNLTNDDIEETVSLFFQASLANDSSALKKITSSIPDDFYVKWNECEPVPPPDRVESPEYGEGQLIWGTRRVTEIERSFASTDLQDTVRKIREQNLDYFVILDRQTAGDHALVKVDFGDRLSYRLRVMAFEMERSSGRWRIFAVTTYAFLMSKNPHFAGEECRQIS